MTAVPQTAPREPAARPGVQPLSVETLDAALRAARVGIWEVGLPSYASVFSDSFYTLLGVVPGAGRAEPDFWSRRVHPEDAARVNALFLDYTCGAAPAFEAEYRLQHADGSWLWVLARAETVWRDAQGQVERITGVTVDIQQRKQAEESLRESEERFRLAAASANGMVYEADLRTRRTVLHGAERLTGHADVAAINSYDGWMAIVHPDDREKLAADIAANRGARTQYEMTYRLLHRDGHAIYVWHRGIYLRDAGGEAVKAVGIIEDVTTPILMRQELARSEFRLRAVADMSPGYVFQVTLRDPPLQDEIFASASFERLMGCTHDAFLAAGGLVSFCIGASKPRMERAFDRMRAGLRADVTLQGRNHRGEEMWLRVQSTPVYDSLTGRRAGTIGAAHDITAERRAELALKESQLKLQTLAAASPTQLALFDTHRRCLFANFSLRGQPVESILGLRIEELLPPEAADTAIQAFNEVIRTGLGRDVVDVIHFPRDPPRTFEIRIRPVLSEGVVVGIVTNISDVTEQRRVQENLALQAQIIETMREGVLLLDRSANILLTNPAIELSLGYPPGTIVGRNVGEFTTLEPQAFREFNQRVLADIDAGEAPQYEIEGRRADGSRLIASCISTGVTIASQRRLIVVISDVTERKQLEREVLQVAAREQQRIGGDLHDGLGQQLTGVALLLKGVTKKLGPLAGRGVREEVDRVIALVNAAIESTRSMARGLSPVSAGHNGLQVALQELANRTHDFYRVDVTLDFRLPDFLRFDDDVANQLYRIAQEAVTNAVRHGKARHIAVQLHVAAGQAELSITDDGQGFDPRSVLPTSTGLKIMRFRAQVVGGYLTVDAVPGAGATLRCRCPVNAEAATSP
jgi:PAS domain S-box-containing protein